MAAHRGSCLVAQQHLCSLGSGVGGWAQGAGGAEGGEEGLVGAAGGVLPPAGVDTVRREDPVPPGRLPLPALPLLPLPLSRLPRPLLLQAPGAVLGRPSAGAGVQRAERRSVAPEQQRCRQLGVIGRGVGAAVGSDEGAGDVGIDEGDGEGARDGAGVGRGEGAAVDGVAVGFDEGSNEGRGVGLVEGACDGAFVGA